ncbi:acetyl-CoA carboxylase biotin carboxyl carrier protein [Burkholderia phage PE067]|nr:acetyl-CoA carboxylase biotin carboxyl carrier protein [Burkholderia phage PE067]NOK53444.1 hypothetical protein [Burkholderia thailandensis]
MSQKQTTELTVVERAAVALMSTERETSLRELVAKSTDMVEIKNAAARDQVHGAAMALRTARTDIQKAGKAARDDANAFSKAVIAEENRLIAITEPEEKRLIGLRDEWDEAREAEKRAKLEAEQKRVAAIREHIDGIRAIAVGMAGCASYVIAVEIEDLEALEITLDRFAELTGEAEAVRGATLDKLRELHAAARAHEAEQERLAAEREALERERAALAEQQRQEAEARAAREREEAAARVEQERVDRERREAEEAARRAQQEREDADRRAAMAAEEARLAEQRAEQERRQAELDRAEREQREREETALREAAEATAQAERDRVAREQADNRAARLDPKPTAGNWYIGDRGGCVVSDLPVPGAIGSGHNEVEHYGGYLICESVWRPADAAVLAAARDAIDALKLVRASTEWSCMEASTQDAVEAAIAKATYVPAEETAAA